MAGQGATTHVVAADNFLIPNATFIVELVLFVVILGIIARYILPPAQKAMRERQAVIRQQVADSEEARTKLADAEARYQDALRDARSEAAQIREDARAESQRTLEDQQAKAREEYQRIVDRGEAQLRGQRDAIMRELRGEIGALAIELSEKIIDQPLGDDAQVETTVDTFLAGLAAQDAAKDAASSGVQA